MDIPLQSVLAIITALCCAVAAWFVFRWARRALVVIWCIALFFVPIWIGVQAGIFFSVLTAVTLMGIATSSPSAVKVSMMDVLIAGFALLIGVTFALGWITYGHMLIVAVGWLVPYVWGRLILTSVPASWVYSCLAGGAVAAAILAIIEFLTGVNLFIGLTVQNELYKVWGDLQYRSGLLRVEGAFGHSIALGASLAICVVFVVAAPWPAWLRLVSQLLVMVAVGVTFSRIGMIGLVLTMCLAAALLARFVPRQVRIGSITLLALVVVVGAPIIVDVMTEAGQEAAGSAEYRGDLVRLIGDMAPFGITPTWSVLPNGETYYGTFQSIDSELVLTGLRFGLVALGLLLIGLGIAAVSLIRGKATPASVALVAQIPAFATVALITQYASLVWFVAGLAVASYTLLPRAGASPRSEVDLRVRSVAERALLR